MLSIRLKVVYKIIASYINAEKSNCTTVLQLDQAKDLRSLIFSDDQVEYIVSLSYCFFSRIKISSLQRNPQILCPSKISVYTVFVPAAVVYVLLEY